MEEFRVCMAVDDAGLAFDARSRYLVRIVLVDGSHGAYGGAFAAVVAFFKIGERFCLEEFCRLTVFAQRPFMEKRALSVKNTMEKRLQ